MCYICTYKICKILNIPGRWDGVSEDASKLPVCQRLERSGPGLAVGGAASVGVAEGGAVHAEAAQLVAAHPGGSWLHNLYL